MNRTVLKYFGLFAVLLVIIVGLEWSKPKRIDWHDTSLSINSKKPFGLFILNQEFDSLLTKKNILKAPSFSQALSKAEAKDSIAKTSFFYVNHDDYMSEALTDTLLNLAEKGHTILISSAYFDYLLLDTLDIAVSNNQIIESTATSVWTTNENLAKGRFDLKNAFLNDFFQISDTKKKDYEVLGFQENYEKTVPNFIRIPAGNGQLYLHSQPLAFSNYNLLESNNHLYIENILSYLDTEDIYWIKKENNAIKSSSLLRFILAHPALKSAWYLFLIGLVLFVLFTAKRKQRIIPIIPPVKNTTIAFTKTISSLYIDSKDYREIMRKQVLQSLEEIRRTYRIDTKTLDTDFLDALESKSGISRKEIQNWMNLAKQVQSETIANDEKNLIKLNQATEKLWK